MGALAGLLLAGLALRVIIAYLLPGSGFQVDLDAFRYWAADLAQHGPWGFYDRPFFHDYTPGYLYVLWLLGYLGQLLGGLGDLIKLPAIIADLVLGWLAWSMVRELGGSDRKALLAAALVLFVPITWFDSVVWGQVDSVGVVFLLLALRAVWRDQPEAAALWGTIAAIVKPQLGIIVPIVAAVVIRRALMGRPPDEAGLDPEPAAEPPPSPPSTGFVGGIRAWSRRERGPVRILTTALVGVGTAIAISLPFGLSPVGLVSQIVSTAGGYPYVTVNAYNPWALVTRDGQSLAATGSWLCDFPTPGRCPTAVEIGPVWAIFVGMALIVAIIAVVMVVVARHPDRRTVLVGLAILAIAFFVAPTRVHERYLFPYIIIGTILAAVSIRWRVAWVVLVIANFLNLYVVLTTLYPNNPSISDWFGIGPAIRSPMGVTLIALAHLLAFLWAFAQLRPGGRRALAAEVAASGDAARAWVATEGPIGDPTPEPGRWTPAGHAGSPGDEARGLPPVNAGPATGPVPVPRPAVAAAILVPAGAAVSAGVAGSAVTASSAAPPSARAVGAAPGDATEPAEEPRPAGGVDVAGAPGPADSPGPAEGRRHGARLAALAAPLRRRLDVRPTRADRSRALAGEKGGRFDRLDLWILVVLVIASLSFRLYRLDAPATMHFDEVYHARTATEFLQFWRYGLSHDIYEYTHPHLAKYAMAGGIVLFGNDQVTAQSDLGVPVRDAAIEGRWEDPAVPGITGGDHLYVATGSDVRVYDLVTRQLLGTLAIDGAQAVAASAATHMLYVGTASGEVRALDTTTLPLDVPGDPGGATGSVGAPVTHLLVTDDGAAVVATTTGGGIVALDPTDASVLGRGHVDGAVQLADAGSGDALVARPAAVTDPAGEASVLADIIGGDVKTIEALLRSDAKSVVIPGALAVTTKGQVEAAVTAGKLPGLTVESVPRVGIAGTAGLTIVSGADASTVDTVGTDGPAGGVTRVTGIDDDKLYVSSGTTMTIVRVGGTGASDPAVDQTFKLPAPMTWLVYDPSTQMVHALGDRLDGSGKTVYVIEPHGNATYADAKLPFTPSAWALDAAPKYPATDRLDLLNFSAEGAVASVDVGNNAVAWRLPGVLAGVLTAALLYLLGRLLFRRRSVAVVLAVIVLVDPMMFVQSRIAMNDVYAGLFIVAAALAFAVLWFERWRWRGAFWVLMPIVGVLLGLALASKWVGAYAMGAIAILVLVRSALGRVILIGAMLVLTTILGYIAVSVPSGPTAGPNLLFLLIMAALTIAAVVITVLHPVAWTDDEVRFAVGAPAALGILLFLAAVALGRPNAAVPAGPLSLPLISVAFGLVALAGVIYLGFLAAGRAGFGPMAPPPAPDDPVRLLPPAGEPPPWWLRPGTVLGLPVLWMAISIFAIPIGVYIALYIPWAFVDGHQLIPGWPPGHTGQTLADLTVAMYNYHDQLRATHAAASPWWAWPLDLKPVWFYQGSFAGDTAAAIYDHGSLVTWWLAIPAMLFVGYQAFRRRSQALALIVILFLAMWIPWIRIDRATFQYHWYTALPFMLLALAYLIAELWTGPSRRIWLMVRVSAAVAVMGPVILWVFKAPLCTIAGVEQVYPDSPACVGNPGDIVVTARVVAVAAVTLLGAAAIVWQLTRLGPPDERDRGRQRSALLRLVATAVAAGIGLVLASQVGDTILISAPGFRIEVVAIILAIPLAAVAWVVLTSRDARRFAAGVLIAAGLWTLILYPNIAALPLPTRIYNAYQGILPTYLYVFQFGVNTDQPAAIPPLASPGSALLLGTLTLTCLIIGYSAWMWRLSLAEQDADRAAPEPDRFASGTS